MIYALNIKILNRKLRELDNFYWHIRTRIEVDSG